MKLDALKGSRLLQVTKGPITPKSLSSGLGFGQTKELDGKGGKSTSGRFLRVGAWVHQSQDVMGITEPDGSLRSRPDRLSPSQPSACGFKIWGREVMPGQACRLT